MLNDQKLKYIRDAAKQTGESERVSQLVPKCGKGF